MTLQALSGFYSRRRGLAQISHQRLFLNKEPTMSVHEEPERPEIEIYREMLDHLEDIVFCHAPDGRFLFMRPAAEKFLGYRSEDLPGLDFAQIIPTDYLEEAMRRTELAKLDAAGQPGLQSQLQEVLKGAKRARDLVKQILTFSRQGRQERKPIDVRLILKEALRLLRATLPSSIEIRQNIRVGCGPVEA
jgi:PAS domain S-box-containing protein